jgi:hypothetical protein
MTTKSDVWGSVQAIDDIDYPRTETSVALHVDLVMLVVANFHFAPRVINGL